MQDIFIEYMVQKQRTPKTLALKLLVVVGAAVVIAAAFLFLGAISILAPLIVVGVVYGAYHLITSMNIEYEYAVTNGELDVDKIIAQRKRKRLVTVDMRHVEDFARYRHAEHQQIQCQTKIIACDNPESDDVWYCIAPLSQSGRTMVVFNANQKMLEAIKSFLPRPLMHKAFRVGQ